MPAKRTVKKPAIRTPDYDKFRDLDGWPLQTACSLVCGVDPKYRPEGYGADGHVYYGPWWIHYRDDDVAKRLFRLWDLAMNAIDAGVLYGGRDFNRNSLAFDSGIVRPAEFIEWAHGKGYSIPPELSCRPSQSTTIETTPPQPAVPNFCFQDRGPTFRIRYEGVDCDLPNRIGVCRLHRLISNPGVDMPLLELDPPRAVDMPVEQEAQDVRSISVKGKTIDKDNVVDSETLASVKEKLRQLKVDWEQAQDPHDGEERNRIEKEIEPLIAYVKQNTSLKGKPRRRLPETTKQIRAIRKSIDGIYDVLQGKSPALEAHLRASITISEESCYKPDTEIDWQT